MKDLSWRQTIENITNSSHKQQTNLLLSGAALCCRFYTGIISLTAAQKHNLYVPGPTAEGYKPNGTSGHWWGDGILQVGALSTTLKISIKS